MKDREALLKLAYRLCGNRDDAEDLVQKTLVTAWLKSISDLPQLNVILKNHLKHYWRHRNSKLNANTVSLDTFAYPLDRYRSLSCDCKV